MRSPSQPPHKDLDSVAPFLACSDGSSTRVPARFAGYAQGLLGIGLLMRIIVARVWPVVVISWIAVLVALPCHWFIPPRAAHACRVPMKIGPCCAYR